MFVKLYQTIALGGTFDHFHLGHEHFLQFAHQLADFLVIGVTNDVLAKSKKYSYSIQSYEVRKNAILKYCHQQQIKCKVVKLANAYGPTLEDDSIQALAVTEATVNGGRDINLLRSKLSLRPLEIHVGNLIKDEDGETISSTKIRAGLINRSGMRYDSIFQQDIILNDEQKKFFSQLQGELVTGPDLNSMFNAVVGDRSLKYFLDHQWSLNIGVYDLKERRTTNKNLTEIISKPDLEVKNSQGLITKDLIYACKQALINDKKFIFIDGEDDLAAVALMLLLPLEANIYYGQPNQGMVEMTVTENKKKQFFDLLNPNLSRN